MRARPTSLVLGLVLLMGGLAGLAAIITLLYDPSVASRAWGFRLGLAGGSAASALAQTLVLVGGWMVWRSLRPER